MADRIFARQLLNHRQLFLGVETGHDVAHPGGRQARLLGAVGGKFCAKPDSVTAG